MIKGETRVENLNNDHVPFPTNKSYLLQRRTNQTNNPPIHRDC